MVAARRTGTPSIWRRTTTTATSRTARRTPAASGTPSTPTASPAARGRPARARRPHPLDPPLPSHTQPPGEGEAGPQALSLSEKRSGGGQGVRSLCYPLLTLSQRTREQKSRRKTRPSSGFRDGWITAGLILLAWAHRIAFLLSNRDWDWPYTIFYEGDSEVFFNYARSILGGTLYDNGIPFHPPGFAYVLAFLHGLVRAAGASHRLPYFAVKVVMAPLGRVP